MEIVLWILCALLGLVAAAMLAIVILAITLAAHAQKLMFGLPWMRWLTMDDVASMGYSRFYSACVLSVYHDKGDVEARVLANLLAEDQALVDTFGFSITTAKFHEFRLIRRPRRGRREPKLLVPRLLWGPVHA